MVIKAVKWLAIAIIVLFVGLVVILMAGSQMSLDRDYSHTREANALPVFSPRSGSGLVAISANNHIFRARVAGFGGNGFDGNGFDGS